MVGAMMVDSLVQRFQHAGGQSLYALAGLADIHIGGGPIIIATAQPGKRPEEVEQFFRDVLNEIIKDSAQSDEPPLVQQIEVKRKGDAVLIGTKSTLARYGRLQPSPRSELLEALAKLNSEGALIAAVFCPGSDYRHVSRELWPELPGALAPLRGELADRWLYFAVAINPPPDPKPRVVLQAKDADSAAVFVKLWRDLPLAFDGIKEFGTPPPEFKQLLQILVQGVPPQQDGARVTLAPPADKDQRVKLQQLFASASDKALETSRRRKRMSQFKQLALGLLNYESVKKHLPAAAIYDKNGRPLLSWRVAILPYLDQNNLYKQFHLDEAWDSPHNISLIGKMPRIYLGLGPKADQ
jgi:hypothetical protein